jgi:hypothetical protein
MSPADDNASRRAALRFGVGAFALLAGLGAWQGLREAWPAAGIGLGVAGGALLVLALVRPRLSLAIRGAWLKVAGGMARLNTGLLLGLVFFLVLSPLAWVRRRLYGDLLRSRWAPGEHRSYWQVRRTIRDPRHYERPY